MGEADETASKGRKVVRGSALDGWVPWLLLLGAAAFGIGWIVGVVGLWASDTWNIRDKILGTAVWPGGLVAAYVAAVLPFGGSSTSCDASGCVTHGFVMPPWLGVPALILSWVLPIVVAVHLIRVQRRRGASFGGEGVGA